MYKEMRGWVMRLVMLVLMIGLMPGFAGVSQAREFPEELKKLVALQIIPDRLDSGSLVTYQQFVYLGQRLMQGWKEDGRSYDLGITIPEGYLSYQEALKIAGMYLGYMEMEGIPVVKELTPDLTKETGEFITVSEMSYIFDRLLQTQHRLGDQSILRERYLTGYNKMISSKIMRIRRGEIELEDDGVWPLASGVKTYQIIDGQMEPYSFHKLYVGMEGVRFVPNQAGEIMTILVEGEPFPKEIRVLISQKINTIGRSTTDDFAKIEIMADQPYKIMTRENGTDKIQTVVEPKTTVTFTNEAGEVRITMGDWSQVVSGRVYLHSYYPHILYYLVQSTTRQGEMPQYQGTLEVFPSENEGRLYLLNELPIEWYLRKVVPSEVPASWDKEVFKVQAIAARSYAIHQIFVGRYQSRSAHVDDSTTFQVYNNAQEHPVVNEAIEETKGILPLYNGNLIDAVFFSTSAGHTAGNEEVWHSSITGNLSGYGVPYLRPKSQLIEDQIHNLAEEEQALAFFKDQSVQSFDSASPYFRWRIELAREMLENTLSMNLPYLEMADQRQGVDLIQTLGGMPLDAENFSIGKLLDLRVVQRGQGGNMMTLDIISTHGVYRVMKELNIRMLIQPTKESTQSEEDVILYLHNGQVNLNYPILPSAFAVFDLERSECGKIEKITIYGGGNGHGVGMSQWGVKGMAEMGYTYEEILRHYYQGIELKQVY